MPFWTRQTEDGKNAAGLGVYLVGATVLIALGLYAIYGGKGSFQMAGPPPSASSGPALGGIATAVDNVGKVKTTASNDQSGLGQSTRGVTSSSETAQAQPVKPDESLHEGESSIYAALTKVNEEPEAQLPEKPLIAETGPTPDGYTPPPASIPNNPAQGGQPPPVAGVKALTVYRRTPKVEVAQPTSQLTGFDTGDFLPRGYEMEAYILTRVETGNLETKVTLGLAKNATRGNKVIFPYGTRLIGSSAGTAVRNRIPIRIDTVLFPSGEELKLNAVVRDWDKMTGVRSYYFPPPKWVQIAPFVTDFLSAYLGMVAQAQQQRAVTVQLGGAQLSSMPVSTQFDPQSQAINAASSAIKTFSDRQMQEIYRENAPYNMIPPGTKVRVVIEAATDVTRKSVNGAAQNTMRIMPGFENNAMLPSGNPSPAPETQGSLTAALGDILPNGGPGGTGTGGIQSSGRRGRDPQIDRVMGPPPSQTGSSDEFLGK